LSSGDDNEINNSTRRAELKSLFEGLSDERSLKQMEETLLLVNQQLISEVNSTIEQSRDSIINQEKRKNEILSNLRQEQGEIHGKID